MQYVRQSTAGQVVEFGPFVDDADGNTAETALTIANTDIRLLKHAATAEVAASVGGTHIAAGRFYTTLGAGDTDTIGRLTLSCHVAGALPVKRELTVLHANVYDVMFGAVAPSTLTQAGIRGAVGLASADLDSQLAAIPTTAPLDATETEAAALAAVNSYAPAKPSDLSGLLTQSQFNGAIPANFGALSINASGEVVASNMVAPAPDSTAIQSAANAALVEYQAAKTADLSALLTQAYFAASLPPNFGVLSIDASGNVSTTGGGSGGATAQEVWEYATRTLTSIDLSGLEVNALTPTQAAWLEAIYGKTSLIGTDGALAVVVTPIGSGGEITLYSGVDYVDTAAGPLVIPVPAAMQSRAPELSQAVYFQGRHRRTGSDYFDVAGTVIDDPDAPGSKAVSIPIPRGKIGENMPFDDKWYYFVGDRPASLQDAFMTGALKICPGPIPPA